MSNLEQTITTGICIGFNLLKSSWVAKRSCTLFCNYSTTDGSAAFIAIWICSRIDESQKRRLSIEFPGYERSIVMQIVVVKREYWFIGAANKDDSTLPPPNS